MTYPNADPKHRRIDLSPKKYRELRVAAFIRAGGQCETCGAWCPVDDHGHLPPGHLSHIISKGAGGDDVLENVKWACWICHHNHHAPQFGKGKI